MLLIAFGEQIVPDRLHKGSIIFGSLFFTTHAGGVDQKVPPPKVSVELWGPQIFRQTLVDAPFTAGPVPQNHPDHAMGLA